MKTYDILNAGPRNRFMANGRIVSNSGRAIQLQNLVRNDLTTLDEARELIKMGCFDMVASIYGNVPDILSQLIRTMLIPKPGCEFIVADFSAIEARVLAWLSGEQWRLDAFNRGEDIYCASASAMFGVPVVKHGINGELRAKGKVAELACIAEGQLVLTDCGYVPIENVKKFMAVWDGDGWVSHDGVIYKGLQNVINYDGLTATPDHLVYVNRDKEPVPFQEIAVPNYTVDKGQMPVYDILNAGSKHRFLVSGKLVHNCGYQGGVGALTAMGALDMGLKEDDLPKLISDWRQANPNIVKFWWDLEQAATETTKDHQERTVGKINVQYYANTLWLVLPSCRKLAYINPKLAPNRFGRMSLTYEGLNAANKWDHIESYGGKLAENCIAKGSLVLTSRGLIPGVEWVHHEGIIYKGIQETIEVSCNGQYEFTGLPGFSGLHMTPEHKILTTEGWRECGKSGGLNWVEVSLPDDFEASRKQCVGQSSMVVHQTKFQEQVYDIRNCGPRHRFAVWESRTGCLRIVSNCTQATPCGEWNRQDLISSRIFMMRSCWKCR